MADTNGFEELLAQHGEPRGGSRITPEQADNYKGRVPNSIIDFWLEHGFGSYLHGRMWLTDPIVFDPLLKRIFDGDPDYNAKDMATVLRGAYAQIMVWDREREGFFTIRLNQDVVDPSAGRSTWLDKETGRRHSNDHIISNAISRIIDLSPYDESDEEGRELTSESISRYGQLNSDEIFGFFPALQMGGPNRIEQVRKTEIITHLHFLIDVADLRLRTLSESDGDIKIEMGRRLGPAR